MISATEFRGAIMPNAATIAIARFESDSRKGMDNQSTESEAVVEHRRSCGQKTPSDAGFVPEAQFRQIAPNCLLSRSRNPELRGARLQVPAYVLLLEGEPTPAGGPDVGSLGKLIYPGNRQR